MALAGAICATTASAQEQEKSSDDPTKIATKAGISYTDEAAISGSLAFGPATKVNARISESGQWSLGASYLFPFGIVTFSASSLEFDNEASQTRYSLGGFIPVTAMGVRTGNWQVFVPFGYTYTEGEVVVSALGIEDPFFVDVNSRSGYTGLFAIYPFNEQFTLLSGAVGTVGTDDFTGISLGTGLSYHFTEQDTLSVFASVIDNSFGSRDRLGISYRREF
ncbi:hypothetical protein GSH16_04135 [Rhodobacteraceae bacterium KN286]|uniref:Outer membrane protein beta-barrel domain-containing protein n=1 Tax=Oceanomicrobium pacificus TaxID=2692916 RepID=A0A6B0TTR9_9RHOB|nr:hypothetical protein [Oceanomicrobium pacificus]